jgi:hypothetical protein
MLRYLALLAIPVLVLASAPAGAEDYRKVETCDGGALTIDVDQDSPRTGQVVIRDRAIIDYLVSRGVIEERFGQRTVGFDSTTGQPITEENAYELVLRGQQDSRISAPGDFVGFEGFTTSGLDVRFVLRAGYGPFERHSVRAFVYREGGAVKVRFDEEIRAFSGCTVPIPFPQGYTTDCAYAGGQLVSYPAEYQPERASWLFHDCHAE